MYDQPAVRRQAPVPAYDRMLESIRYEGAYPTLERADETVRRVMAALGRELTGDVRADLAARLPLEAALAFTGAVPDPDRRTGWGFVKDLAARNGISPAVARWDTGAVLSVVARLAGPDLLSRVLRALPEGYALLFGQAELTRRQEAQEA
ncbi:DUF2267 domain-containing protein [Streptomyces sp. NPDC046866]|uniref:DUF2267 domain-containing protein n=1 Tax=Streptomyces sp. NPDC046866 TaxID=3154921 RepID=UPI00345542F4